MVNYHTSTLLESSEHVFVLIRYKFFGVPHPTRASSDLGRAARAGSDFGSIQLEPAEIRGLWLELARLLAQRAEIQLLVLVYCQKFCPHSLSEIIGKESSW